MKKKINPEDYIDDIRRAARQVAADYGGRFDVDDIASAITVDMMTNASRYNSIGGSLFFEILKRAGKRYCVEESANFLLFSAQYTYSTEEIKELLPKYYTTEVWPNGLSRPRVEDFDSVEEFQTEFEEWNNATRLVIDMMDIEFALDKISEAQRKVIKKKYRDGERLQSKYERNKHSEALRFLAYHVNSRATARMIGDNGHEGPGARQAMSNSRAQYMSSSYQDDDKQESDPLVDLEWYSRRNHPLDRPSRYVVGSPWRENA